MIREVKEIDEILQVKLGEPVSANGAGEIWTSDKRLQYINIAYNKLKRILHLVMRGYKPEFASQKSICVIQNDYLPKFEMRAISIFELPSFRGLPNDVMTQYLYSSKAYTKQATYIKPTEYLKYKYGISTIKTASFKDEIIYYTFIDSKLHMLPEATSSDYYTKIELILTLDTEFYTMTDTIFINNDYMDMLIDLAAIQGMQDVGRGDKVQLYRSELYDQIKLLAVFSQAEKQEEGELTND